MRKHLVISALWKTRRGRDRICLEELYFFLLCIIIIVLVYPFALNEMNEVPIISWWRHQMETFSALLALCVAGDCTPSPVDSPHKGQWRGALIFSFICGWINGWANNRMASDSRRHSSHYDVIVMFTFLDSACCWQCYDLFVVYGRTPCKTMCGCSFPSAAVHIWASWQIRKIVGCSCAGNAGSVSPTPRVSDLDMHHGTCVTHVPWCIPGSPTSGFLWSPWRG